MLKKLLVGIAAVALLFSVSPAMANGGGGKKGVKIHMFQAGAAGNVYYGNANYVLMANGTAGLQSMAMKLTGNSGACATQTQGSFAAQSLVGNGITLKQVAAGFQTQRAHAYSHNGRHGRRKILRCVWL